MTKPIITPVTGTTIKPLNSKLMFEKITFRQLRQSVGTYDDIFDGEIYKDYAEANKDNNFVIMDLVIDQKKVIYICAYHVRNPSKKLFFELIVQNVGRGVHPKDEEQAYEMAYSLLK